MKLFFGWKPFFLVAALATIVLWLAQPRRGGALALRLPATARRIPLFRGHSHNDYEQPKPLEDALKNRFYSIEADIWLKDGQIEVSHWGWSYTGTLQSLYLDPIQKRVSRLKSVYGDSKPVYLWLDVKDSNPDLAPALQALLSRYPMLTRFEDGKTESRPVEVVLTGDGAVKRDYVSRFRVRYACRDGFTYSPTDSTDTRGWCWYGLRWGDYLGWDGNGTMPDDQRARLRRLVDAVHAKGRKLRFWNAPDTPEFWEAADEAGVDLIGTDYLPEFSEYFGAKERKAPQASALPAPRAM